MSHTESATTLLEAHRKFEATLEQEKQDYAELAKTQGTRRPVTPDSLGIAYLGAQVKALTELVGVMHHELTQLRVELAQVDGTGE